MCSWKLSEAEAGRHPARIAGCRTALLATGRIQDGGDFRSFALAVAFANKPSKTKMVPRGGIEPPTLRFSVACSTN